MSSVPNPRSETQLQITGTPEGQRGLGRMAKAFRDDLPTLVSQGYGRALEMLKAVPYAKDAPELPKLVALETSAKSMGAASRFYRPPINVNFGISNLMDRAAAP